jgi:hypothetical protein
MSRGICMTLSAQTIAFLISDAFGTRISDSSEKLL